MCIHGSQLGLQVAALVFYMLCEFFNANQFVTNFVVCIVLLAMDFWVVSRPEPWKNASLRVPASTYWWQLSTICLHAEWMSPAQVKNVTGRLLVGLRWWNDASDAGSTWRFESLSEVRRQHQQQHGLRAAAAGDRRLWAMLAEALHCVASCPHQHPQALSPPPLQGQRVINPHEKRWFWIVLIANPILWALASLTALLGFSWGE